MEGDQITLQDIFDFDYAAGIDDDGRFLGTIQPTGLRPRFGDRLKDLGIVLPADAFGTPDFGLVAPGRMR